MPRGKKEGSVFYNKFRDRWMAQYYYKDSKTGVARKKSKSFLSKELAERYLDTVMYQKNNPIYIKKHKICLGDLMKMRTKKKLDTNIITENSLKRINNSIEIIKKSYLYNTRIDEITTEEIQNFLNTLTGYSNSVIKKVYGEINQTFTYAFNHGYIIANPMADVVKPKSKIVNKKIRALRVDEQSAFIEYLKNCTLKNCKYKNIYFIQMFMGLRIGEVLALKISDVDLQHSVISITKTLTLDKQGNVIMGKTTKTYAGTREVPIPLFIKPYIIEQLQVAKTNRLKLLFTNSNGTYLRSSCVTVELKKILLKEFNITGISSHSLRHTFGTRCVEGGMKAVVVQKLMGHTNIHITLDVYTDVFNKFKEDEIEKLNDYYMQNSIISETADELCEHNPIIIESKEKCINE